MLAPSLFMLCLWLGTPSDTWQQLIDARLTRDTSQLSSQTWQPGKQSRLAMQEYLLTLGQVSNPDDASKLAAFLTDKHLGHSAILAYGEIDGAPTKPLFEAFDQLDDAGQQLAIESISKLGGDADIQPAWAKLNSMTDPDSGLFHMWRLRTPGTDQAVQARAAQLDSASPGIAYYLYRGRVSSDASTVAKLIEVNAKDAQALIYTLRIPVAEGDHRLLKKTLTSLTRHTDWRVSVNALNALANLDQAAAVLIAMDQRFAGNPNVASNACALLGRSADDAQHAQIAREVASLDPAQFLNVARNASEEVFQKHYQGIIATWKHHADRWNRGHWVRLAAKMHQTRTQQPLAEIAAGSDEGMAALALQSLAAGDYPNWPEVAQQVWQRVSKAPDPMLMGDIAGSVKQGEAGFAPIELDTLLKAAEKAYADPKFHYDFINNLASQMEADALAPHLNTWADHDDYLVRLKAVQTMAEPSAADRAKIYQKPWQHEVPQELKALATSYFNTKDKVYWELTTPKGKVTIQLQPNYAPITVANIVHLSEKGFFNGVPIHRVVPNFVVQGGDVRGDGMGGPEHIIPCEINALRYQRGAVGMALSGKDTGGSQFFICHSAQPHLDGGYTVFGHVREGMRIVDTLQEGDLIKSTRIYRK